jgi:hypothetical protein
MRRDWAGLRRRPRWVTALVLCVLLLTASIGEAADFAAYRLSFGEGPLDQVQELAVAPGGGSVILSDVGQVRRYSLDGQVLERLYWAPPVPYFLDPLVSIACGVNGDVYVGNYVWGTLSRLDEHGVLLNSAGGNGSAPGQFLGLTALVLASDGTLYAADFGNDRVQHFSADLVLLDAWQTPAGNPPPMYAGPDALAVDSSGNVWVGWTDYNGLEGGLPLALVICYDPKGQEISRFALAPDLSDPYVQDTTWLIRDMAFDPAGELHVLLDSSPERRQLLSFYPDGTPGPGPPLPLPWWTDQFAVFPDGSFVISGQSHTGAWAEYMTPSGAWLGQWGDDWWAADRHLLVWPTCVGFDTQGRILACGGFKVGDGKGGVIPAYAWLNRYTTDGALVSLLYLEVYPEAMTSHFAFAPDGSVVRSDRPIGIDHDGNQYLLDSSDYLHCKVKKSDANGSLIAEWDLGMQVVMIVMGMDDHLYASRQIGVGGRGYGVVDQIERYDLDGHLLGYWDWSGYGGLMAVDPGGRGYFANADRNGVHSLQLYSGGGELLGMITSAGPEGLSWASSIALTEDGLMAVSESQASRIHLFEISRSRFSDIPWWHWAKERIEEVAEAGIVEGYPDGTYRPSQPVTRADMAVYMSRALAGGDANVPSGPAIATFPDVPTDYWAYKYVEYCYGQRVVHGYWDGYHPEEIVNRGQMAVYIARAIATPTGEAGIPDPPAQPSFPDVTSTNEWAWCYRHVEYIHAAGVARGYPDGLYHPGYTCTRDQMAVYVAKAFGLTEQDSMAVFGGPRPWQRVGATRLWRVTSPRPTGACAVRASGQRRCVGP